MIIEAELTEITQLIKFKCSFLFYTLYFNHIRRMLLLFLSHLFFLDSFQNYKIPILKNMTWILPCNVGIFTFSNYPALGTFVLPVI